MNKYALTLAAAVAAVAGCKDPDYRRGGRSAFQNDVKRADTAVAAQPARAPKPAQTPKCACRPGTRHTAPCACAAPDCTCIVETPVAPAPVVKPAAPAPAPEQETTIYTVRNGDYLAKISRKFNVTIAAIKRANGLKKDVVRAGQKLKIPGRHEIAAEPEAPKTAAPVAAKSVAPYTGPVKEYVVKNGDTLGSIAYGHGINIRQLKALNGIKSDTLKVGQKLKIPAAPVAKAAAKGAEAKDAKKDVAKKADAKKDAAKKPEAKKDAEKKAEKKADAPAAPSEKPADAAAPAEPAPAPAADAQAHAPAAPAAATTTYVVQEGDDMTGVSIRWGVSAAEIRELNNLGENDKLKPGQVLKLPAESQQ